jgi:hypothetical protein
VLLLIKGQVWERRTALLQAWLLCRGCCQWWMGCRWQGKQRQRWPGGQLPGLGCQAEGQRQVLVHTEGEEKTVLARRWSACMDPRVGRLKPATRMLPMQVEPTEPQPWGRLARAVVGVREVQSSEPWGKRFRGQLGRWFAEQS